MYCLGPCNDIVHIQGGFHIQSALSRISFSAFPRGILINPQGTFNPLKLPIKTTIVSTALLNVEEAMGPSWPKVTSDSVLQVVLEVV